MKIFDSQNKIIWRDKKENFQLPSRIGKGARASTDIGSGKVSSIKIIGRKISGDGVTCLCIRDKNKVTLFSKTFKFTKTSLSEITFREEVKGDDLEILIIRPKSSVGAVYVQRVLIEGPGESCSRPKRSPNGKPIDYPELTKNLTRQMRLAIIVPYGIYGGGEVYIKNLISGGRRDFEIDVLFLSKNKLMNELETCPVNVIKLGGASGLRSRLHSDRYDYIVFYNSKKVYDILLEKKRQKTFSSKIIEIYHSDFTWSDAISKIRSRTHIDKMFRVAEGLAKDITGIKESDKVCVPVGVDFSRFRGVWQWPTDVRKDYKKTIGMVARLSPEKNIDYAMSIMKLLPEYQLIVLGEGPLRKKLENRKVAENISNVSFLGHKVNVEEYYSIFDALLLTSKIEGTPISIVEALMCGLPVFSTPVGQIESVYSGLRGVIMLTRDVDKDAEKLRGFNLNRFEGSDLEAFAVRRHNIDRVRDLFFSNILNASSSFAAIDGDALVLDGEYV
jgi:glycosyltransferase involved in cell wall biosynthesis